jgi:hypothetical protein
MRYVDLETLRHGGVIRYTPVRDSRSRGYPLGIYKSSYMGPTKVEGGSRNHRYKSIRRAEDLNFYDIFDTFDFCERKERRENLLFLSPC